MACQIFIWLQFDILIISFLKEICSNVINNTCNLYISLFQVQERNNKLIRSITNLQNNVRDKILYFYMV